jgi:S-adenosylmethionine:tRNA ribosyltransferase-isomerase
MVVRRDTGLIEHRHVRNLPELLTANDLLVLNDTKVLPARLRGNRGDTGGKWEGLFLRTTSDGYWEILSQTRGRLREGDDVVVEDGPLRLRCIRKQNGHWLVAPNQPGTAEELLGRFGHVPLPPYIRKGYDHSPDRERYQTVFAEKAGAVAAPTAGLHFTPELLERLTAVGVRRTHVTLHVGTGTFQPIQVEDITKHEMHFEWAELSADTVKAIQECRTQRGRVVAVGTTSVRTLESVAATGPLRPWSGETNLFIYPPYEFKVVNSLLTNFHLPKSSLLVLVSAFAGIELIREAYRLAIAERYRFYSYGDAMLILGTYG